MMAPLRDGKRNHGLTRSTWGHAQPKGAQLIRDAILSECTRR